jgi:hypothetical protein
MIRTHPCKWGQRLGAFQSSSDITPLTIHLSSRPTLSFQFCEEDYCDEVFESRAYCFFVGCQSRVCPGCESNRNSADDENRTCDGEIGKYNRAAFVPVTASGPAYGQHRESSGTSHKKRNIIIAVVVAAAVGGVIVAAHNGAYGSSSSGSGY